MTAPEAPSPAGLAVQDILALCEEDMEVGSWRLNDATDELEWSERAHRLHGTDPGTFGGRAPDAMALYWSEDQPVLRDAWNRAREDGRPFTVDTRLTRPNGSSGRLRLSGRGVPRADGRFDLVGLVRDISEGWRIERDLRDAAVRYELALGASQDGVWDWNPLTGALWTSPRLREMLGWAPTAGVLQFTDFTARLHPSDREATLEAIEAHLRDNAPFHVTYRLRHASGRWLSVRSRGQAITNRAGEAVRMVSTVSDMTHEVQAERTLAKKNAQLQRSNLELERFAAVASHDMKEPLRKIRAFCDRLIERGGIEDARSVDYLQRARRSADRMYQMVQDLLEIARVPADSGKLSCIDLNGVAQRAIDGLAPVIEDAGAKIIIGKLPFVLANEAQIAQVFHNLLDNALKYRNEDHPPVIHVAPIKPSVSDQVGVEVRDNGIGFDPRFKDRIFGLFERLHGRDKYSGTGLGLALCKRIIEEHGGRITVQSKPGEGSRFIIEFFRCEPGHCRRPELLREDNAHNVPLVHIGR